MGVKEAVFKQLDARVQARRGPGHQHLDAGRQQDRRVHRPPQDVVALHFFSPANVMKLLEVVRAPRPPRT